jgi:Uma2 family endonuclease
VGALLESAHVGSWTVEEWMALNEASNGNRCELLDGSLLVSPAPSNYHQYAADELRAVLRAAAPGHLRVLSAAAVQLTPSIVLVPDLVVMTESAFHGPSPVAAQDAALVVEVVSSSTTSTDRLLKPAKCAAAAIPSYWRVEFDDFPGRGDARLPVLFPYTLDGDAYRPLSPVAAGALAALTDPFPVKVDPAVLIDSGEPASERRQ